MGNISRRDFLKLGAASAAVLALESQFRPIAYAAEQLLEGGRSVNRTSGLPRSFLPSTCMQCPAGCGIIGYVEESRLVKIGGNSKHISNLGTLCARGQAGINAIYDPQRLLEPLKRVGPRGSGSWEPVSWDDALDEVASTLGTLKSGGDPREFVFLTGNPDADYLGRRFTHAFGSPNFIGSTSDFDANKRVADRLTWGAAGDMPDVAHSKYILVLGANPLETGPNYVGFAQRMIQGIRDNQAKLVVFDVRLTNTSAMSNEMYYVNPGTIGLVTLAMANVIMQEGLYRDEFIRRWTNVTPEELAGHLAQYTPERAAAEAGVDAAVIRTIATEFATTRPATTVTDASLSNFAAGVQNERAAMLLSIITGNIDTRGGLCLPRSYDLAPVNPEPPQPPPSVLSNPPALPLAYEQAAAGTFEQIRNREQKVSALMTHNVDPAYSNPDLARVEEVLADETLIPYHVAVTPFMTETARFADIILPETTYLEDSDIIVRSSPELVPFVALRQPVVPPLEKSRPFFDIASSLAGAVKGGMEQYFAFGSVSDYLEARVAGIGGLQRVGGLDYLRQHGVWYDPKSQPDYGAFRAGGFRTPSGKLEVRSALMAEAGQPALPSYETSASLSRLGDRDMAMCIFDTALHSDWKTGNCMWLDEIEHHNPVWINPRTAESLGIEDGDTIKLTRPNIAGDAKERSITATAYLTEGIHPRVVAMANGVGHTAMGNIAQAEKIPYKEPPEVLRDPNTELVWWGEEDGSGVNPKRIVPVKLDPVGGGEAWGEMVVTVAKV